MNIVGMAILSPLSPPKPHFCRATALPSSPSTTAAAVLTTKPSAVIIGGGLSGLAAATRLLFSSVPFLLLESSDGVGGRVRTDSLDGFLLDRGFQILLTAYPEARRLLHYPSLRLRPFYPGALVFHSARFHRLSDPLRRPLSALSALTGPVGTLPDKLLVALHRLRAAARSHADILSAPETSTLRRLSDDGFSRSIVDGFFRPFLAGIFFDPDLSTTSRLFDFVFKCLAEGDNALPAAGIAAIPDQLASRLPPGSVRLRSKAVAVVPGSPLKVKLEDGGELAAELGVIVAVDQPEAERLLPQLNNPGLPGSSIPSQGSAKKPCRSTVCLYFSADRAPIPDPILILNGSGRGIVNNMFFPTNVAPSYGPQGKALVSVSLIGLFSERSDEDLTAEVLSELSEWFGGEEVRTWRHLRTYRVGFAQPGQDPPTDLTGKDPRVGEGVYICGDHRSSATFDGALVSGRVAAEALIRDRVASRV